MATAAAFSISFWSYKPRVTAIFCIHNTGWKPWRRGLLSQPEKLQEMRSNQALAPHMKHPLLLMNLVLGFTIVILMAKSRGLSQQIIFRYYFGGLRQRMPHLEKVLLTLDTAPL
jgi:hypothetical protein